MQAGWHVCLPLESPAAPRTELVLQTGHAGFVTAVAFSPDGRMVLTGSYDKTAILWDAASGRQLRTFRGHDQYVCSLALLPWKARRP